jgi:hypothetical protein
VPTPIAPAKHLRVDLKRRRRVVMIDLRLYIRNRRAGLRHQRDERAPELVRGDGLGQRWLLAVGAPIVRETNGRGDDASVDIVRLAPGS